MGTTPNYNIQYPDSGDQWDLINDLQALADTTDTAIDGVDSKFPIALGSNVSGFLPIANGGTGATDIPGAQNNLRVGLVNIKPTSVTPVGSGSSAINGDRTVTFTGCSGIYATGIFSSSFRNYKIIFDAVKSSGSSTDTIFLRMSAGTTDSTIGYLGGFNSIEAGFTAETNTNSSTEAHLTFLAGAALARNRATLEISVFGPNVSLPTQVYSDGAGWGVSFLTRTRSAVVHDVNSSYDSIYLGITGSSLMSGRFQVFGIKD